MKMFHVFLALAFLSPAPVHADSNAPDAERPRIGLALSGGGARGSAHIGVLQALEELGVKVDYIAGTSMGAIIGGMYASGYSADEIEDILVRMDWESALMDRAKRVNRTMRNKELEAQFLIPYRLGFNQGTFQLPLGLIEGQHLDQVFREILLPVVTIHDFSELPIPFSAVATDLVTGEEVVLSKGSLPDSLRASMSVPGVFSPVSIGDRLLVDGGMSNNLPVSVVREMGADVVIAVDISSTLLQREQFKSVFSVTEQLTNFLTRRTTDAQIETLGDHDLLIVPELEGFSSADFTNAGDIVSTGYEAAMIEKASLAALSTGRPSHEGPLGEQTAEPYVVGFVELENSSVLHDEIIRSRLAAEIGQPLDLQALDTSVDQIYSLDVFKSVTYDIVTNEEGETGVIVRAVPREWGPNYMQFGLELATDFSGNSDFKLGAAYTRNALNYLGGELRVTGSVGREDELSIDFYQPIDTRARWFVESEVFWNRQDYDWWVDDVNVSELELKARGFNLGLGRNFNTTNRLRLTYIYADGKADIITGNPDLLEGDRFNLGELELQYIHDSLNNIWFPSSGTMHKLEYLYASESLGASLDYEQATANGTVLFSIGKNTALLNYELGYSFDDAAPVERWYRMGGFGRLSGLAPDQLLGRHTALATLAYYRRLTDTEVVSAYTGFTLEAGNAWDFSDDIGMDDLRYSGSVFIGANSPLGPAYFAVGYADSGDLAAYFYLGNPFRVGRFD